MTAKRHHYNPQVYLRQFVWPGSKLLWEYDVRQGTVKLSTPKESGCEDYYHSFESVEGGRDDDTIEASLSQIENKLPKLFETVRNQRGMTVPLWSTLFVFAGLQRARCPKTVHAFQISMGKVYEKMYDIWKDTPEFEEAAVKHGLDPMGDS